MTIPDIFCGHDVAVAMENIAKVLVASLPQESRGKNQAHCSRLEFLQHGANKVLGGILFAPQPRMALGTLCAPGRIH
jgi:hypothetical protein